MAARFQGSTTTIMQHNDNNNNNSNDNNTDNNNFKNLFTQKTSDKFSFLLQNEF